MKKRRLCKADMNDKVKQQLLNDKLVLKDDIVQAIHEFVSYSQAFAKTAEDSIRYYSVTIEQQMQAIGDIGSEEDFRDNRKNFKYLKHLHSTIVMCNNIKKMSEGAMQNIGEYVKEQDSKAKEIRALLSETKQASYKVRSRVAKAGFFDNFKKKVKEKAKDLFHYDRKSDAYKAWVTGEFGSEEIYAYSERLAKSVQESYRKFYGMSLPTNTFINDLQDKEKFQSTYDMDLSDDVDREAILVSIETNNKLLRSYIKDIQQASAMVDKPQQRLQEAYDKVMNY